MSETDFTALGDKRPEDRTVMHVLYALHTVSWASMYTLALIAVVINYVKRADEMDAIYVSHHNYMIATFWWTVLWLVVTSPLYLLFLLPGIIASTVVGLWYLYRCLRGWLRFTNGRPPQ